MKKKTRACFIIPLFIVLFTTFVHPETSKSPITDGANRSQKDLLDITLKAIDFLKNGDMNSYSNYFKIIRESIDSGDDINQPHPKYGYRMLNLAIKENAHELAWYFIENGAWLDRKDGNGNTPLHYAAAQGNLEMAQYLVEKGVRIDPINKKGETPLYFARMKHNKQMSQYLEGHGADPYYITRKKKLKKKENNDPRKTKHFVSYVLLPLAYTGISIYLYEDAFKHNPEMNWMAGFNAYTTSILASSLVCGFIGFGLWPEDGGFLGRLNKLNGLLVGIVAGIPVGILLARQLDLPSSFQAHRGLYYIAPVIALSIPIVTFRLWF